MSLSLPAGFRYSGLCCGIKRSGKDDLALIVADERVASAGVYTTNLVHAASIDWNRAAPRHLGMRGVVVNSGNANACTGARGVADNARLAALAAQTLGESPEAFFVMSTGVIGHFLPMTKLEEGMPRATAALAAGQEAFRRAATAITTTDQFIKIASYSFAARRGPVSLVGMGKGAGMIGPNMATMLAIVTTDADLSHDALQADLAYAANRSFNCISVEGHMSTNDSLVVLASGRVPLDADERVAFREALTEVCIALAKQIPDDGEGATHLVELRVSGAIDDNAARQIAQTVANSPLVKTALLGNDPNWGRIVSAAGYAGVPLDPAQVSLTLHGHLIFQAGTPTAFDAKQVHETMKANRELKIELVVGQGPGHCRFWTSDLTVDYVRFNSEYTT